MDNPQPASPTVAAIFLAALRLGCTSFGGPVAHLAFFRRDYVERRGWISGQAYAELVALCQFLPGPASSQTGFGIGYLLRGWAGGLAAWTGFTLPSAVLMAGFALGLHQLGDATVSAGVRGLKIAAAAVVAHAVLSMWRSLAPDWPRSFLVVAVAAALLVWTPGWLPPLLIVFAAIGGVLLFRTDAVPAAAGPIPPWRGALLPLGTVALLFAGLAVLEVVAPLPLVELAARCFRAGALVFGGGHVVLPLLEREFLADGAVTAEQFLTGYAAAQAVPGPLFTFATYLGAVEAGPVGAVWATVWIFLPGLLLVPATLPLWAALRTHPVATAALRGANAAVVGLLLAALITPVGRAALTDLPATVLALGAFALLHSPRVPAWAIVLACGTAGPFLP